jgi:hypothetical protein
MVRSNSLVAARRYDQLAFFKSLSSGEGFRERLNSLVAARRYDQLAFFKSLSSGEGFRVRLKNNAKLNDIEL